MALNYDDIRQAASALHPAQALEVAKIAQLAAKDMLEEGKTWNGDVVGGDVGDGLNANTEDSSTVTQARQVKAAAGRVTSILCTTGSAITLTLYDNAAASATGRQIYTGSLSAGDVVIPDAAWFAHGCYAGFTGTATFVISTSEASE